MKPLLDLMIELAGGIVLLFSAGWLIARISGYDAYYDKMLYDEEAMQREEPEEESDFLFHPLTDL